MSVGIEAEQGGADSALLDLLSISQTWFVSVDASTGEIKPSANGRCLYGAPLIAIVFRGHAAIQQASCNHWDCPACGEMRARTEYRRMVYGAQALADEGHKLYFWTITCRGKELSYADAMAGYLSWTNRLLTNARAYARRKGIHWAYAQVTEHQKKTRAHPHSHLLTTFLPVDALLTGETDGHQYFVSEWLARNVQAAGLGQQYRFSQATNVDACARYIAKYMFKTSQLETWPPHWKRVRYSQNWPKPPYAKADWVTTLLSPEHWRDAAYRPETFVCETPEIYEQALHRMANITRRESNLQF